ncbi:MAG: hypothetical protein ACRD4B_03365 [Acidobacteriota bacterium]
MGSKEKSRWYGLTQQQLAAGASATYSWRNSLGMGAHAKNVSKVLARVGKERQRASRQHRDEWRRKFKRLNEEFEKGILSEKKFMQEEKEMEHQERQAERALLRRYTAERQTALKQLRGHYRQTAPGA